MPNNRYTKEILTTVIADSTTWADVCRKLDVKPATGAQTHITRKAKLLGIDYSHFVGQRWAKGKSFKKKELSGYLVKSGPKIGSAKLRSWLIKEGLLLSQCSKCKRKKWLGKPIPLELDHINSDHYDNRLENLQILCPTCHAVKTIESRVCRPTAGVEALRTPTV